MPDGSPFRSRIFVRKEKTTLTVKQRTGVMLWQPDPSLVTDDRVLPSGLRIRFIRVSKPRLAGRRVFLKNAAGKEVSYYILGAWDGDADRDRIAYRAPLGKALLEHKVGEKVQLPELGECLIEKLEALPPEMIQELSGE